MSEKKWIREPMSWGKAFKQATANWLIVIAVGLALYFLIELLILSEPARWILGLGTLYASTVSSYRYGRAEAIDTDTNEPGR